MLDDVAQDHGVEAQIGRAGVRKKTRVRPMSFAASHRRPFRVQVDAEAFETAAPGRIQKVPVAAPHVEQGTRPGGQAPDPANDPNAMNGVVFVGLGVSMMSLIVECAKLLIGGKRPAPLLRASRALPYRVAADHETLEPDRFTDFAGLHEG